jgi:hypothetical protein
MAHFLTGNELNTELERLFERADSQIILISPFIKLHDRYASTLRTKISNPQLEITIVFGKNEDDISRSMKQEDFNFFKEFPNIEIRYEKRLHAKYYCNETSAILTSMNLYSFSQDNNIEAGVMTKATLIGNFAKKLWDGEDDFDTRAWKYFLRVIEQSELLYKKVPEFENSNFGLTKKYRSSKVEIDKLSDFFQSKGRNEITYKKEVPEKKTFYQPSKANSLPSGFCIRTGKPIPFNTLRPMCDDAFTSWSKFGNENYPEKYCHFSGEPSNGETTKAKPIMRKNWRKAKETYGL